MSSTGKPLVVGVHGVVYQVFIPLSSFDKLPPVGAPVRILTHLQVREDAHVLYGFMTVAERDLFRWKIFLLQIVEQIEKHFAAAQNSRSDVVGIVEP